ncbi:hypothetical protein GJA_2741 [Janthinobacterium agaricidamnosum NBRC 102515 = DSM 9628]|uniref:Uncharacterized protein n=1 Tax=Janthinobacterium agaricidamnosum NBRC 102515 = DSM 9628 TaxID=1349767 RepID=W0V7X1_9BURK|nr:hypothetical protein GJA_2741 [Janthinobacterium agaricidamnosum NBRC 102515 = DSM 9628]
MGHQTGTGSQTTYQCQTHRFGQHLFYHYYILPKKLLSGISLDTHEILFYAAVFLQRTFN